MNFDLSEDDAALQDSVARWVQQRYPFDARRKLAAQVPGFSREHWREMARLGWLALPFDDALGGLGGVAFMAQLLGTLMGIAVAVTGSFIVYGTLKKLFGLRLDAEEEYNGADLSVHKITSTAERETLW